MTPQQFFEAAAWHLAEQPTRRITAQGIAYERASDDGVVVTLFAEGDALRLDVTAEGETVAQYAIDAATHAVRCLQFGEHVATEAALH